jgi:CubicO group peptidase (beta-lactamase class C family)
VLKKDLVKEALHLIDHWLDYQVYIKEIPGASVGIYFEDETIFRKDYGYSNLETKERLNGNHLFRIASHSKLFTATAIMKLYNEDKLSIDDRVSKYLPWFSSEKDENLNRIRISHLLTHSSGITRDGETGHWYNMTFPDLDNIISQIDEGISFFETSETLKYSNFGYTLLGQIIEGISGISYEEYIQQEILNPLNMNDTFVDVNNKNEGRHATGYKIKYPRQSREAFPHVPAQVMHSATGFSSTVEDLIKFYKAHMFGNETLFPDYIKREMQRIQYSIKNEKRGYGFGETVIGSLKLIGHGGGYPGFITRSGLDQKNKLIMVVLTNAVDGPALTLMKGIGKIFDYLLKNPDKFLSPEVASKPQINDFLGVYGSHFGHILFSQINNKLISIDPFEENPLYLLQLYEFKDKLTFVTSKDAPFRSPGQPITFKVNTEGKQIIDSEGVEIPRFNYKY